MSRAKPPAEARARRARTQPKPHSATGSSVSGRKRMAALCVLLAGATIALYSPVAGHPFIAYDDSDYVTSNTHVHEGLSWSTVKWAFTTMTAANWHPLTWLSHALDYQFFGLNPGGHHLDSVLIHSLNAVILFLLLAWVTKRVGPSLLVAALFAIHPLNVESVAWVAERKNVLSTLFFFWRSPHMCGTRRNPDWRRYLLVAGLFAAGLMAKPMVITLPFVLLLLDYWPLERMKGSRPSLSSPSSAPSSSAPSVAFSKLVLEKIPLLLLSAASAWITLKAQRQAISSLQRFPLGLESRMQSCRMACISGKCCGRRVLPCSIPFLRSLCQRGNGFSPRRF